MLSMEVSLEFIHLTNIDQNLLPARCCANKWQYRNKKKKNRHFWEKTGIWGMMICHQPFTISKNYLH